jgi:Response regulator
MMHIHIIDDDPEVRRSLNFMLMSEGIESSTFGSAEEFLERWPDLKTGCILADVRMPGMSGLDLQVRLREANCNFPFIMMSGHGEVSSAVRAMKAGAIDFLEKPFSKADLLAALAAADAEQSPPTVSNKARDKALERLAQLTNRERAVLQSLVEGRLNKRIARDLDISPRTVEAHRANAMRKLGVHSLSELLQIAFVAGIYHAEE